MIWILEIPILILIIAFVVNRSIHVIDNLVVGNLFRQWRSTPSPPPLTIIPSRSEIRGDFRLSETENYDTQPPQTEINTLVTGGSLQSFLSSSAFGSLLRRLFPFLFPSQDQNLVYYIRNHGHFLRQDSLWQRIVRWIINDPAYPVPYSLLEAWLARREGVAVLPKQTDFEQPQASEEDEQPGIVQPPPPPVETSQQNEITNFIIHLVNQDECAEAVLNFLNTPDEFNHNRQPLCIFLPQQENTPIGKSELLQILQIWADYIHLRNQHTHEAFTRITRQIYLVIGILLGIFLISIWPHILEEISASMERPGGTYANRWVGGGAGAYGSTTYGWARRWFNAARRSVRS